MCYAHVISCICLKPYKPATRCTVLCCSWSCPTWWTVGRQRVRNSRQSLRGETGTVIQCAPCTHLSFLTPGYIILYSPQPFTCLIPHPHSHSHHHSSPSLPPSPITLSSPSLLPLLPPLPLLTTCSWKQGENTNFKYLMELNKLAG